MVSVKALSVLAVVAGSAVAMPAPLERLAALERRWSHPNWWNNAKGDWNPATWTDVSTVTATATTVVVTETAATEPEATVTATPASSSTPSTSEAATSTSTPTISSSSSGDYIDIVNKWRTAGGLATLTEDSTLEANALKTSTNSVGGLIHELNPGTMAQVLAPGTASDFEEVYVGGWLCEVPSSPGLDGICSTASDGWSYDGQTGHNEILTSTSYTKIGCAIASSTDVWACDLA